ATLWKKAFVREPYYREVKTSRGIGRDTFETAVTWDNFSALHSKVMSKTHAAIKEVTGRKGTVTCRFTHLYPDGPAPYFTFHFYCDPSQVATADMEIKAVAYDTMIDAGGTITHHHAIGRMHMPWYLKQRPEIFGKVLESAKTRVDPMRIMNPGVIVPTRSS
ncbi:MAG: FAD-linked oxidase C-terminal domain-containing protein, partial [Pseudomonadota bacterium]|nr:FAD-linked oxidase C-terminal domain-containing protein [Pseudomonadota bacterium]